MPKPQLGTMDSATDAELIGRVLRRDETAVRALTQRYNRRLYRVARSVVRDDGEAEDVLQEAYLRAFSSLADFRGQSSLSTWLTRIVLNEAFQRLRHRTDVPVSTWTRLPSAGPAPKSFRSPRRRNPQSIRSVPWPSDSFVNSWKAPSISFRASFARSSLRVLSKG